MTPFDWMSLLFTQVQTVVSETPQGHPLSPFFCARRTSYYVLITVCPLLFVILLFTRLNYFMLIISLGHLFLSLMIHSRLPQCYITRSSPALAPIFIQTRRSIDWLS